MKLKYDILHKYSRRPVFTGHPVHTITPAKYTAVAPYNAKKYLASVASLKHKYNPAGTNIVSI